MKIYKVLHVLSSKTYNGAENVVSQIHSMLSNANSEFEIVYCSLDGPVRKILEEKKIKFFPVDKICKSEINRVINNVKPDIIHAHDMRASFFSALACGDIPLVSHIHNNNFDSRKFSLKAFLYLYSAFKAKHIFWVSNSSFNGYCFHNFFHNKSEILFNVINQKELMKKALEDKNMYSYDAVYLGRLTYQKNPQRLITLLEKIVSKVPRFQAAILGDGEDRDELLKLISKKNLVDNIHYLGFSSNPYKILMNSKMMLLTSRWEGTPMCALEALSLGVPIVSTPVDGMCDLIKNDFNGYLSNDDYELSNACIEIYENNEKHNLLSLNAKATADAIMSVEHYSNVILKVYRNLIS